MTRMPRKVLQNEFLWPHLRESSPEQNRRQKDFTRGLSVCAGGIDIVNLTKTPLIYHVSYFNLRDLELCLGRKSMTTRLAQRSTRTKWRDYISNLACFLRGVEPAQLYKEVSENREVFQTYLEEKQVWHCRVSDMQLIDLWQSQVA